MESYLVGEDLWDVVDGSSISPPVDGSKNSSAHKNDRVNGLGMELLNQSNYKELLAKQLASMFVKDGEGDALVADKRNFKGKSRDMSHSRFSSDSSSPGKKEDPFNYYGKKPLKCYRYGNVGHIKRYCRAKESNMAQKVPKEEEKWEQCLVAKARAIDAMISINLEGDWI
ncbi:hypothetical protein KY290_006534 [Solanum tuberosum]|uniref:CCHC-type domain-containing protein n=1 Tax=Solanum tuberosum TaxID=4113 RepID=A0ABQ7WJL1_SOLTU|nr:hypothetical protein KY290_006534 [Solanum tuberosum]